MKFRSVLILIIVTAVIVHFLQLWVILEPKRNFSLELDRLRSSLLKHEIRTHDALAEIQREILKFVKRSEHFEKSQSLEQSRRRRLVRSYCESNDISAHGLNLASVLVEDKSMTAFCYLNKVASTTWIHAFASLKDGLLEKYQGRLYQAAAEFSPGSLSEFKAKLYSQNYYSFLAVRNPFVRLISAYRDRVLDGCTDAAKNHIPRMLSEAGKEPPDYDARGCVKDFPGFGDFLAYLARNPNQKWRFDAHWTPYYRLCSACLVDFDAIVMLETAKDDEAFVMKRSKLDGFLNLAEKHPTSGGKSADLVRKYYSDIHCDIIRGLYHIYEPDFNMYGYNITLFYDICNL